MQPADDLAGLLIVDQDRQRPVIAIPGLVEIIAAEPVADRRLGRGAGRVGHGQGRVDAGRRHQPVSIGRVGSTAHSLIEAS